MHVFYMWKCPSFTGGNARLLQVIINKNPPLGNWKAPVLNRSPHYGILVLKGQISRQNLRKSKNKYKWGIQKLCDANFGHFYLPLCNVSVLPLPVLSSHTNKSPSPRSLTSVSTIILHMRKNIFTHMHTYRGNTRKQKVRSVSFSQIKSFNLMFYHNALVVGK